ncbi:hypothetical protein HYALB_00007220 [Hymenoscyphus albidus]|uniref:DNA mismatch repair protein S5 domain-containing protein n=1 Tax=Hymenoscyphus albidus TaxID=595503 RepID=A0A9N9LEM0_9HELO|nr:hypothetical protein HYALB_00007220 [Hymenoscyphus albidus]
MPIHALPQSTIHLLGSAQALTIPTSLVKELIDNALDAKATSVDILVSQNTLDKIQVRDNGHGIPLKDLDALGRRGHTSKLTNFEELRFIGGTTLGFRGEALASAVQLGEVSVTTRTDGDAVATTAVLQAPGGIARQSRTSHPVGTTICVTKFMFKLPVRKQTALKSSSKTLIKIKELLQAYALARPSVRFSLKVLKESKGGFSYAPRPTNGIKEAVSHVIGKDASAQCVEKTFVFSESQPMGHDQIDDYASTSDQVESSQFHVSVYLPRPDAEPSKIGRGQFLSIDSRPVSHDKGTMKRIVTMFKGYLKVALGENADIKNPFIRFDIKCPVASYDPNVEPAKDDVLFGNESLLLDSFESFFKEIYGEKPITPAAALRSNLTKKLDNFELLLARKPTESPSVALTTQSNADSSDPQTSEQSKSLAMESSSLPAASPSPPNSPLLTSPPPASIIPSRSESHNRRGAESDHEEDSSNGRRRWDFDISKDFVEIDPSYKPSQSKKRSSFRPPTSTGSPQVAESTVQLNPWVIAKMTAPVQPSSSVHEPLQVPPSSSLINRQHQAMSSSKNQSSEPTLSDHASSDPAPRLRLYGSPELELLLESSRAVPPRRHRNSLNIQDLLPQPRVSIPHTENSEVFQRPPNDFISARNMSDTLTPPPPPATHKPNAPKRASGLDKPFLPPRRIADNIETPYSLPQTTILAPREDGPNSRRGQRCDDISELDWAMTYEHNKELATQQLREERRIVRKEAKQKEKESDEFYNTSQPSPHKNRQNAAIAALEVDNFVSPANKDVEKEPVRAALSHSDPRSYLMRHPEFAAIQSGSSKLTRTKSIKLPLERIPDKSKTTGLVLKHSMESDAVKEFAKTMARHDLYVARGIQELGLGGGASSNKKEIARKFQAVVEEWMAREDMDCEVDYKFQNLYALKLRATM